MMTNLLCGLVEQKVHYQTDRPRIKNFRKGSLTFPMYKRVFHNGVKKEKLVMDCEGSKRLMHIYGVYEIKNWSNKILVWMVTQGFNLVIVYLDFVCNKVNLVVG